MSKRTKAKPTRRNVDKSPEKSPPAVVDSMGRPLAGVAVRPELRGRGPETGAPNAGRPPNAWRDHARLILDEDGAAAAREILRGNPDQSGRVPDQALRIRLIEQLTAIGFNEPMRKAKLDAEAAAAASLGPKAQAGVQIILEGGPAGNERRITDVGADG